MSEKVSESSWLFKLSGIVSKGGLLLTIALGVLVVPLTLWFVWAKEGVGIDAIFQTVLCVSFVWFLISTMRWGRAVQKLNGASSTKLLLGPRPEKPEYLIAWRLGRSCRYALLAMFASIVASGFVIWLRENGR